MNIKSEGTQNVSGGFSKMMRKISELYEEFIITSIDDEGIVSKLSCIN